MRASEPTASSPDPQRRAGLVVHATRAQRQDPLRFLGQYAGEPRFYYRTQGLTVAGVGIAADLRTDGPDRFTSLRDQARAFHDTLGSRRDPGVPANVGPVWMGGATFEPRSQGNDAPDFPACRFVLPRLQLRIQQDGVYEVRVLDDSAAPPPARAPPPDPAAPLAWTADQTEHEWTQRVRAALHEIQTGRVEKVVLARTLSGATQATLDPLPLLGRLQSLVPHAHVFLLEPRPGHAWIGASPEIVARRTQGTVETVALAGSRPRGGTPDEDARYERSLRASSKEAWEHELVCRFLRTELGRDGREWHVTQDRGILKLPNVQHLETRFLASTQPHEHVLDLAQRLHPTPAVSGTPRDEALALLRRLEGRDRGLYAGVVGAFDPQGDGELAVAIRSAHIHERHVRLFAGCGIVNGSDPAEEWTESSAKFQLMQRAFDVGAPLA